MHMRYALESTVLALGAMERSVSGEVETHQDLPLFHLKDLQNHLDAISNLPRKVSPFSVIFSNLSNWSHLRMMIIASSFLHVVLYTKIFS